MFRDAPAEPPVVPGAAGKPAPGEADRESRAMRGMRARTAAASVALPIALIGPIGRTRRANKTKAPADAGA